MINNMINNMIYNIKELSKYPILPKYYNISECIENSIYRYSIINTRKSKYGLYHNLFVSACNSIGMKIYFQLILKEIDTKYDDNIKCNFQFKLISISTNNQYISIEDFETYFNFKCDNMNTEIKYYKKRDKFGSLNNIMYIYEKFVTDLYYFTSYNASYNASYN